MDFTDAIRLDPQHSLDYHDRGYAFYRNKDYNRAIADYSEAIRLDPNYARAYDNRGDAFAAKGDLDRAIAEYDVAIKLDPKEATYWNDRCSARATANREVEQALGDCNEALRLKPGDANTLQSRGLVYLQLGRLDDSIADYDAALKINPMLACSLYGRGLAKLRKDDPIGANTDLLAAKEIDASVAKKFSASQHK